MKKNYQTKAPPAATEQLVMPDTVAVAIGELAETQFRRVNGFLHLPGLRLALEAHVSGAVAPECDDGEVAA